MKYRMLKAFEVIREGDEIKSMDNRTWIKATSIVNDTMPKHWTGRVRRPIRPQKRKRACAHPEPKHLDAYSPIQWCRHCGALYEDGRWRLPE